MIARSGLFESKSGCRVAGIAADGTGLSQGCLLVEHPVGIPGRVGRRVLVVLNVDVTAGQVTALCVNRPTALKLREVRAGWNW